MPGSLLFAVLLGAASVPPAPQPAVPRTTSTFVSETRPADAANAPGEAEQFALAEDAAQRMTVQVKVGERGPFAFLVDTGSERTAISRQLASELGLGVGAPVRVHSLLGTQMVATVNIPQLGIGRQALSVSDAPTFEANHMGAAGILGIDSLRAQRVVFDFKRGEMQLTPGRQAEVRLEEDTIVIRARSRGGRLVLTKVMLDGVAISAIIDTGSQMSIGNRALMRRLKRARPARPGEDAIDAASARAVIKSVTGQTGQVDLARVRRLDLGGVDLTDFTVAFSDARIFEELGYGNKPAILLGMDAMRLFDKVSIDFAQKKVRFDLPDGAMAKRLQTAARW